MPDGACVCNCHELTRESLSQSIADTIEVCKHKLHKFYEKLQRKGRPKKFGNQGTFLRSVFTLKSVSAIYNPCLDTILCLK